MAVGACEEHIVLSERNPEFLEATSKQLFLGGVVLRRTEEAALERQRLQQIGTVLSEENANALTRPSLTRGNPHSFGSPLITLEATRKKKPKTPKHSSCEDMHLDCDAVNLG